MVQDAVKVYNENCRILLQMRQSGSYEYAISQFSRSLLFHP